MSLRTVLFSLVVFVGAFANAQAHDGHDHGKVKPTVLKQGGKVVKQYPWSPRQDCSGSYGTPVKVSTQTISLSELIKDPKKYEGRMLSVTAKIRDACQRKGCWMMLQDGQHLMRIRFKGYKFFVPTNSKGYIATVVGTAREAMIPAKIVQHYAEESGDKSALRKVYKPQKVIAFTAHFVTLQKAQTPAAKPTK